MGDRGRRPRPATGATRPRAARRSAAPWLALLGLFVLDGIASVAPAAPTSTDIPDTHERLARIYARLGIDRTEKPATAPEEGCRCIPMEQSGKPGTSIAVPSPARMPPSLGYVLLGIVVLVMLVPLVIALRRGLRDAARQAGGPEDELDEGASPPSPAAPWLVDLEACRRLLADGRLAEAFAALHRVTLLELERARQLSLDARTTNWEYVRKLSSRLELREALAEVTRAAEESVLGNRPPGPERFDVLERLLRERVVGVSEREEAR